MPSSGVPVDPEAEEAYYLRLHLLIVKEGTAILKARFDHSVDPTNLHVKLQEPKVLNTITYGKKHGYIKPSQYNLLYPSGGPPSSEQFDVSLLVYLLRSICGMTRAWWNETDNSKIPDTEKGEEADIVRIRNMRNQMQHKNVASVKQADFVAMWDLAEQAMLRLASKCNIAGQKAKIDDLKAKPLDLVTENMRSIRANTEIFLKQFETDSHYLKTADYEKAKIVLQNKQILILTGHPGEGKTTIAARLALEISLPRNCLKLAVPSDWRTIDLSLKLFDTVIIDDIFGASAIDQKLVVDWRPYLPEIESAAKAKAIRVIITSRHYIFEESREELGSLPMFKDDNETVLHLTSSNLTTNEKTAILRMQATKKGKHIPENILGACIEAEKESTEERNDFLFGFPECASMFVRSENMQGTGAEFFRKPASFFKRYLEDLYRGKEKPKFLALVAVWAQESKRLSQSELRKVKTVSENVKKMAEVFDQPLDRSFLDTIQLSLHSHVGGYLVFTEATGDFTFNHNVIGDMVGLVVGKKKPEEILEICPRDFLMQYVTVDDNGVNEFKIVVKEQQFPDLAKKCTNMLLRNNCNRAAENPPSGDFQPLQRWGQRSNDIQISNKIDFGIIKHKAFNSKMFVEAFIDYVTENDLMEKVFNVTVTVVGT